MTRVMIAAVLLASATLAACGDDHQQLRAWMDEQRKNTPTIKDKIPAPKQFEPFRYDNAGQVDPFSVTKLAFKGAGEQRASKAGPDLNRPREALEYFPLDTIRLAGFLASGKRNFALLQADGKVFRAGVGSHAGQNHGVIMKITDQEVVLREMTQDAAGEWVERDTSLRLQENKK